jgi:putative flippase GtrA
MLVTQQAEISTGPAFEAGMAIKFACVGLAGLAVDGVLLRTGLGIGLTPAAARAISLVCAMQVTFAINGLGVFHCLTRALLIRQWVGYMAANGFGNLCNYWLFVTLVSTHWPWISAPLVALLGASFTAYLINYAGTRLLVFGRGRSRIDIVRKEVCGPDEGAAADPDVIPPGPPAP